MNKTLSIEGMSCDHCVMAVEKALKAVPGVEEVEVDLASKSAEVKTNGQVADQALVEAVGETGFEVVGVR
ncbi:MAG: heavy-metal-associated domain-containing protein [Planctomycetota bacterium]|jgi:Cu+-exporting ATPase|nr:heavy-metal-associated domain-containing protein [Planctomycetota bacterium]